jgi:hypothetical protein
MSMAGLSSVGWLSVFEYTGLNRLIEAFRTVRLLLVVH